MGLSRTAFSSCALHHAKTQTHVTRAAVGCPPSHQPLPVPVDGKNLNSWLHARLRTPGPAAESDSADRTRARWVEPFLLTLIILSD